MKLHVTLFRVSEDLVCTCMYFQSTHKITGGVTYQLFLNKRGWLPQLLALQPPMVSSALNMTRPCSAKNDLLVWQHHLGCEVNCLLHDSQISPSSSHSLGWTMTKREHRWDELGHQSHEKMPWQ